MRIDLGADELLTLAQACRMLPRTPSPATLWRWRTRGVRIGERRIRLECVRVGGTWMTTQRAFAAFVEEQTRATLHKDTDDETGGRDEVTARRLKRSGLM